MVKRKKVKVYDVMVRCENCGELEVLSVRYKVSVRDYLEGFGCSACGCDWHAVGWELVNMVVS